MGKAVAFANDLASVDFAYAFKNICQKKYDSAFKFFNKETFYAQETLYAQVGWRNLDFEGDAFWKWNGLMPMNKAKIENMHPMKFNNLKTYSEMKLFMLRHMESVLCYDDIVI